MYSHHSQHNQGAPTSYVPITYIPDGPVTSALKRHVKGRKPKPALGNLGPLLDENLEAAKRHGYFLYHPDDLRFLKDVDQNPEVVDDGFEVLRSVMADKGIDEPETWKRTAPYYPDNPRILKHTVALAAAMTLGITLAVLLGQNNAVTAMVVAIVAISLVGAGLYITILSRSTIEVGPDSNKPD